MLYKAFNEIKVTSQTKSIKIIDSKCVTNSLSLIVDNGYETFRTSLHNNDSTWNYLKRANGFGNLKVVVEQNNKVVDFINSTCYKCRF